MAHLRVEPSAGAARRPTVLVVDDDDSMRSTLEVVLRPRGYRLLRASSGEEALEVVRRHRVDVVFLDLRYPTGPDGLTVLAELRRRFPDVEVIVHSVERDVPTVVQAVKLGAFDYLAKDFGSLSRAADVAERALARAGMPRETASPPGSPGPLDVGMVVGPSAAVQELIAQVARVAPHPTTVLLQGPSGVGKELVARLVHRLSDRAEGPFVAVNLAALQDDLAEATLFGHEKGAFTGALKAVPGRFELANKGTLFLDDVGDLPMGLQAKLLRVLQEREVERIGGTGPIPVDVRIVAASRHDLAELVSAGRLREDLYYRLRVVPLRVPSLHERRDDLPELLRYFLRRFATRARRDPPPVSDAAMSALLTWRWPGNVRELENLAERLIALGERQVIEESDLPDEIRRGEVTPAADGGLAAACEAFERSFLEKVLDEWAWNKAAAARALGISYATMKNKVGKYRLGDKRGAAPAGPSGAGGSGGPRRTGS